MRAWHGLVLIAVTPVLFGFACGGGSARYRPSSGGGGGGGGSPGGSEDAGFFKEVLSNGGVPEPDALTVEGWLSEHTFPMPDPTCGMSLCLEALLGVGHGPQAGFDAKTLLQIGMTSPVDPSEFERASLNLTVVLDVSGSMSADDKLGYAKAGLHLLIDQLLPTDRFGLVTFSESSYVIVAAGPATNPTALHSAVNGLGTLGGTNLHAGLMEGYEQVWAGFDAERVNRVILLTDGMQNVGVTDPDQILADSAYFNDQQVGITTIGVGYDVSQDLLLALAQQGEGNYYFLQDEAKVEQVFVDELDFLVTVIARDLVIRVVPSANYEVLGVHGWPNFTIGTAGEAVITIDTVFYSSRPGTIMVELKPLDGHTSGGPAAVASTTYEYLADGETIAQGGVVEAAFPGPIPYESNAQHWAHQSVRKGLVELSMALEFQRASASWHLSLDKAGALSTLAALRTFVEAEQATLADPEITDDLFWLGLFENNMTMQTPGTSISFAPPPPILDCATCN